jgi:hypothetical protein
VDYSKYVKEEYGSIVGQKVAQVRPLSAQEQKDFGWDDAGYGGIPMVIILGNGAALIPSQDPEGNGPGHIFLEKVVVVAPA